jgi:hypothetical protein
VICQECGNDDACEGYRFCSDCLEELVPTSTTMTVTLWVNGLPKEVEAEFYLRSDGSWENTSPITIPHSTIFISHATISGGTDAQQ